MLGRARLQGRRSRSPWSSTDDLAAISNAAAVVDETGPTAASAGCASPTPWRCPPTWWPSSSGRSRPPSPIDVDGVAAAHRPPARARATSPPFALEVGAYALRFFAEYFGIPYPADKLDLVAIPDFAFGAMENLGCVTFRETVLLVDPAQASPGRAASGSPTWSPTRSPTCGSATWSP